MIQRILASRWVPSSFLLGSICLLSVVEFAAASSAQTGPQEPNEVRPLFKPRSTELIHLSPNKPVDRYHLLNFFTSGGSECASGGSALHPAVEPPWVEDLPDGKFFVRSCSTAGVWFAIGPEDGTSYEITCHLSSPENKQIFIWESMTNPVSRKVRAQAPAPGGVVTYRFVGAPNSNERKFIIGSEAENWTFTSCDIAITPR